MGKIKSPVWIVQPSSKSNVWLMILLQESHFFSGRGGGREGEILQPTHLIQMNAGIDYLLGWKGRQASLDHQQQRKKKNNSHKFTVYFVQWCFIFSHLREREKKVKQKVDKRRRGGKTERESERERGPTQSRCVLPPTVEGYLPRHLRWWDTICCSTLAGNSSAAAEELELSWGWGCRRSLFRAPEDVVPNIFWWLLWQPRSSNESICWRR